MKKAFLKWLARKIAGPDLRELSRYRTAVDLVLRWNAHLDESHATAQWIEEVAKDRRGLDIELFRERLTKARRVTQE